MTRISSLIIASTLAILPLSAIAQPAAAPAKTSAATGVSTQTPAPATPLAGKTSAATTAEVSKPAVKAPAAGAKTETHSMNTVTTPHAKANVPAKTAEPAKS